jgi:class 3 adenylate cyclase
LDNSSGHPLAKLPSGTVTILFSDIEGSTRHLSNLGKHFIELLFRQREILRQSTSNWDGYEVEVSGDSYYAVFERAGNAINCAVEVQKALCTNPWPEGVDVKLRIGIHTGEPWIVDGGYVGLDIHRTVLLASLAQGGQVLLSDSTALLVQDELPEGTSLLQRGPYKLIGIDRLLNIYQLNIEGLSVDFPELHDVGKNYRFGGLPGGTITFLFSDIEGSTKLLHILKDEYPEILDKHRELLRSAFTDRRGCEVDARAEELFFAFSKATDALDVAIDGQRKLFQFDWPEGIVVKSRMGLHTGEPWVREHGYVGLDVHKASRVANLGYGGQVLLAETTKTLVQSCMPPGISFKDLGKHLLKDFLEPEQITQLIIEGMPEEFLPLKSM